MSEISEITGLNAHNKNAGLESLLNPSSIAFIGATTDEKHVGGIAIDHLKDFGFKGAVYPVNPRYQAVQGLTCYPDIEAVPEVPDLAVLAVGKNRVLSILESCHQKGIKAAIVYASGFAEESDEGAQKQQELVEFAERTGMLICGPNCMGLANFNTRAITAFATLFKDYPPRGEGHTSLITQSGNMAIVVYAIAYKLGLKFDQFINTGNEAVLEFSEYLEYLSASEQTQTIIGYIEGLRDGQRFIEVAEDLREKNKPLILIKSGESEQAAAAVMSHTASLAGDREVYKAAFELLGVMQAAEPQNLADLAYLSDFKEKQGGRRVAVASISGAMGCLLTDLLIDAGLEVPALSAETQKLLMDKAPVLATAANPIDLTANLYAQAGIAASVFEGLGGSTEVDVILVYATGYLLDRIADELIAAAQQSDQLFVVIDSGEARSRQKLKEHHIPVFTEVGRAVNALRVFLPWIEQKEKTQYWSKLRKNKARTRAATHAQAATQAQAAMPAELNEYTAKAWLAKHGVPISTEKVAHTPDEAAAVAAEIGFPVVLKILSPDIAHKTEVGGVELNLTTPDAVKQAATKILANASKHAPHAQISGLLVQSMEKGVCELIVGVTRDSVFGLSMTVGIGGIFTEIFKDTCHHLLPVDEQIAAQMLQQLKGYPLLTGYRGQPAADITAMCRAIAAISDAALAMPDTIDQLEVNPMLAQENGALVLDALMILGEQKMAKT